MGLHAQIRKDTTASIQAAAAASTLVPGFLYFSTDEAELRYARTSSQLSEPVAGGGLILDAIDSTSVSLSVNAAGELIAVVNLDNNSDNIITTGAGGLMARGVSIHPNSVNLLEMDGNQQLSIKNLALSTVTVDETSTTLATAISGYPGNGDVFQEGDTLIMTGATGGTKVYIHNGGTAGDSADFTHIESPNIDVGFIRAQFAQGNAGIAYNSSNGQISLVLSSTAGNDLALTGNGLYLDVSTSTIKDASGLLGAVNANVELQQLINKVAELAADPDMTSFSVSGNSGSSQTIEDGETISLNGAGLLKVVMTNNTATFSIDATGAAAGQVITFDGTNFSFTTPSTGTTNSFSNGLNADAQGEARLGGVLTQNTSIDLATFALSLIAGSGLSVQFPKSGTSRIIVDGGDVELLDVGTGLIVRSPNNSRWRYTVANDGSLISTQL